MSRISFVLAAAIGLMFACVAYAADNAAATDRHVKTVQGVVVDLDRYLMLRSEGKSPADASKFVTEKTTQTPQGEIKTQVEVKPAGSAAEKDAGGKTLGLLVTEKGWLSKIAKGHELYVITNIGDPAAKELEPGRTVKITGRVVDMDGVRAISVQSVEAAPPSAAPTK